MASASCDSLGERRTRQDIVWSCLLTLLACTWVSIHPNIPGPDEKQLKIMLRRMGYMWCALIIPEFLVAGAMRQWIVSRRVANKYKDRGWTLTHGFFALMGGFMLVDDLDRPIETLLPDQLESSSRSGAIDFPKITKREVQDRSKGDLLSKGIVILQTGWFVTQCIARALDGLPLSELELVTLAFAALNFVTYGFWWNKPLDVRCAVAVRKKQTGNPDGHADRGVGTETRGEANGSDGRASREAEREAPDQAQAVEMSNLGHAHRASKTRARAGARIDVRAVHVAARRTLGSLQRGLRAVGKAGSVGFDHLANFQAVLFTPFSKLAGAHGGYDPAEKKVGTFYSAGIQDSEDRLCLIMMAVLATVFGAIHCIAWSFEFPSRSEQILWRVASVATTTIPTPYMALVFTFFHVDSLPSSRRSRLKTILFPLYVLHILISCAYTIGRAMLLVLPFLALRALPPGVYQTVKWTAHIPHL